MKSMSQSRPSALFRVDEIEQASAQSAHRRNFQLARADRLAERRVAELLGAVERGRRVVDLQAHRANRRSVRKLMRVREAVLVAVEDEIDPALRPARDRLRLVLADLAESQSGEQLRQFRRRAVVRREFKELDTEASRARRDLRRGQSLSGFAERARAAAHLVHEIDERALAIDRDAARRARAKLVVEDFERQQTAVAGGGHRIHEIDQREIALAGEAAKVPAPRNHIHVEPRRVRKLDQDDLVAGNRADRLEIGLPRKDMEAVERQPDRRVVGAAHHLPGVAVVADVFPPRQRLESDADAALLRPLAKLVKVRRRAVDPAERVRRDIAADHQQVAAKLAHQIELAFGPGKGAAPLRLRHAFEIAERLERHDLQAELRHHAGDILRRAVERQQIALEDLDAGESRRRGRFQLFREPAAERNGCDRGLHRAPLIGKRMTDRAESWWSWPLF